MGFEPQIRSVIAKVPTARQTMFFTATWPQEVRELAMEFLTSPITVSIGGASEALTANKAIVQHVRVMRRDRKIAELSKLLEKLLGGKPQNNSVSGSGNGTSGVNPKVIIFSSQKKACAQIAARVHKSGRTCDHLHSDREQRDRTEIMDQFKRGDLQVLVATDIAARGLDVKDVDVVINFDFPIGKNGKTDRHISPYTLHPSTDIAHKLRHFLRCTIVFVVHLLLAYPRVCFVPCLRGGRLCAPYREDWAGR
jgi:ATP-dependent RNA helicase DDX5/DBP2